MSSFITHVRNEWCVSETDVPGDILEAIAVYMIEHNMSMTLGSTRQALKKLRFSKYYHIFYNLWVSGKVTLHDTFQTQK